MSSVITVDGAILEGGGQVLRIAVSLSTILNIPVKIHSIRAGRSSPGLKAQHLTGLNICGSICDAVLEGAKDSSQEVLFHPKEIKSGTYCGDTRTAGSIGLLLQISLPPLLFGLNKSYLVLKGGTNAEMAPQIDYITEVFRKYLTKFGGTFDCDIIRRGYYPKGGGEVKITVHPVHCLSCIELLEMGHVVEINGYSFTAGVLPNKMAFEMAEAATRVLKGHVSDAKFNITCVREPAGKAFGNGSGIVLFAVTSTGCILGGSALGRRGVSTEQVGVKAAEEIITSLKYEACVDEHCVDQLILLMALAKGTSRIRCGPLTMHTKTAIHVVQQFCKAQFDVKEEGDGSCILSCIGIGHKNKYLDAT